MAAENHRAGCASSSTASAPNAAAAWGTAVAAKSKAKDAKAPKGKPKKAAAGGSAGSGGSAAGLVLAEHPRAVRSIAQAKGWGGLGGFLVGGYLSLPTQTLVGAGLRALAAGVVCYVAVWAAAVFLWRRLVVAELRARPAGGARCRDRQAEGAGAKRANGRSGRAHQVAVAISGER